VRWTRGNARSDTDAECEIVKTSKVLKVFFSSEDGVVAVEWVALAGAVVIGGITVAWIVLNNLKTPANSVGSRLTACETYAASHSGSTMGCR
jgi:hypothetical protein